MRPGNKKDDVLLSTYIKGTEKTYAEYCLHCKHTYREIYDGKHRCQFVLLNKNKIVEHENAYFSATYYSQCSKHASIKVDDKWYCSLHANKLQDEEK